MAKGDNATIIDLDYGLLKKVAAGDHQAFATLLQRHQARIYRLAYRLLRSAPDAEDAVQEIFLKAYQNAGRFTPTGTVAAWLNRIAANHCLNLIRARTVRQEVSFSETDDSGRTGEETWMDRGPASDPLAVVTGKELAGILQQALDRLPENQRQALILKRFADLSYQEIGDLLGLSSGAVDGLLKRARQTLKQVLEEYEHS